MTTRFFKLTNDIIINYFKDEFKKDIVIYSLLMDNIVSNTICNDDTYSFKIRMREESFGTKEYAVIIPKEAYEIKDKHYKQIKLIRL